MAQHSLVIPIHDSDEVVEVRVDELPDDEGEVIEILQAELAPLDLWRQFAVEYYRQGRLDSYAKMLEPITNLHETRSDRGAGSALFDQFEGEMHQPHETVKKSFLAILNSLAAFHTVLGSRERDKAKKKAEVRTRGAVTLSCSPRASETAFAAV